MRIKWTELGIEGWIVPLYHSCPSIEKKKRKKKRGKFPMKSPCRTTVPVFLFLTEFVSSSSCDCRTWSIEPLWTSRPAGRWLNPAPTCSSSPTPATSMISECSLYSAPPPHTCLPPYPLLYLWSVSASLPLYHPPTPTHPHPRLTPYYVYDQWMQPFHCTTPPHPDSWRPPATPCYICNQWVHPYHCTTTTQLLPSTPAMSMISECSLSAVPPHPTPTPAVFPPSSIPPLCAMSMISECSLSVVPPHPTPTPAVFPPSSVPPPCAMSMISECNLCAVPPHPTLLPSTLPPATSIISEGSRTTVPPHSTPTPAVPPPLPVTSMISKWNLYAVWPPTLTTAIHPTPC